jgi:spore coat polysaccharide biosynthesis protein SpsF
MNRGFTIGVLQARTTSSRLPGKVLLPILGRPMILRQLDRMTRAQTLDLIVVATSEDVSDDELALTIVDAGFDLVRGSLDDVLARVSRVIDEYQPDVIVRMTADCPLISPSVIDHVVHAFDTSSVDYASNTMVPTYPDGLDVEVVTANALRQVAEESADPDEREHVTLGIYRKPERFSILNVTDPTGADHSDLRWTVDSPEDFTFVERVYQHLMPTRSDFEYHDVLQLLEREPQLARTSSDAPRNSALDGLDTGLMRHPRLGDEQ